MNSKKSFMMLLLAALAASSFAQSQTITLQQGLNGYNGCTDRELRDPETNYGSGPKEDMLLISEY
jgi:hypothetical protein